MEESSKLKEEFRREYLFSLLLTSRQKELVNKRLRDQSFTKTEREYFSRVVKKKLQALADPDLHILAQKSLHLVTKALSKHKLTTSTYLDLL